jgi:hypothetical protein
LSSKASILRLLTLSNSRAAVVTLNSNCHISSRCGVLQGIRGVVRVSHPMDLTNQFLTQT